MLKTLKKLTYTQILAFGFLAIILFGTMLLCLPVASADGTWTPFVNSLFTATSATCVTGLVVVDTFTHWSLFGQIVIISLIQIGGLGFMTVIILFSKLLHRRISLHEQLLLRQSASNNSVGGILKLFRKILIGTVIFEGLGTVLLAFRFCRILGFGEGLYYALFHSISAFCNAGFDLLSRFGSSSLSMFADDPLVIITICMLIVMGGIGFLVWDDMLKCRLNFKKYSLHTKVVLVTTGVLLFSGWILFYLLERNNAFADMPEWEKWLSALFQSVTTRTAGFAGVDQSSLNETSGVISIFLMLIGGSPGSTAGGLKTTTLAVLVIGTVCCARNEEHTVMFKRRIEPTVVREASAIASIYIAAAIVSAMIISVIEQCGILPALYETSSAIATVGLTMSLTPQLCNASRIIVIILMYAGRIGGLSFILALAEKRKRVPLERPVGKILIG